MNYKIVVLDGCTLNPGDLSWAALESLGEATIYDRTTGDQILSRCHDAEILVTNKVPLTSNTMSQLANLKFVAVTATGYNVIDLDAAREHAVSVSNVPAYSTESVAQHVFAMLLSWLHRPEQHHQAILDGEWQRRQDFSFTLSPLQELSGKTMGIVGMGRIGQATANVARAFGMQVIAHSRTQHAHLAGRGFSWVTLEELFQKADVVSLHCPLTNDNEMFVNQTLLSTMLPQAILINTARGGLIDEGDLAAALKEGKLQAALLDVTSTEPISEDNPLLNVENCLMTPHIAWATLEARRRAMEITVKNIQMYLAGTPQNLVGEGRAS